MVWGRSSEKASGVVAFGKSLGLAIDIESDISAGLLEADLSISTLPKGSLNTFWSVFAESDALRPKGYLFDVNYNPWPSAAASAWGNDRVISGLEMLIYQAVKQVRIFAEACDKVITATNEEIAEVMRGAIS
jgi:shikimate dehydrogenase